MSFKSLTAVLFAVSALLCSVAEVPSQFLPGVAGVFPEAKQFEEVQPNVFAVRDNAGKAIGKLYLETIGDDERKFGYAGTVEIALLFGEDERVAGVLIGKNQETPSFLNRIRAGKLLEQWDKLKMNEIPGKEVDAVTGATLSSEAIKSGVRKLAESALGEAKTEDEKAARVEAIQLERRIKSLQGIVSGSQTLLTQLQTRKAEELELRLIAATQGPDAAKKFAEERKMMFFSHPRRGNRKSPVELAAEAYKADQSEDKLKALKAAILVDYERMLKSVPSHNAEQEKALKAAETRLAALRKPKGISFKTPEAREQEAKLQALAERYKKAPSPELLAELKREATNQVARGIAAMSAHIARQEQETKALKAQLDELLKDPSAVIDKRVESLIR